MFNNNIGKEMTREEQIVKACYKFAEQFLEDFDEESTPAKIVTAQISFMEGARYADCTAENSPKYKELACKYAKLELKNEELKSAVKFANYTVGLLPALNDVRDNPWISVEESLPEMHEDCLVLNRGRILVARRRESHTKKEPDAWCWSNCLQNVTHWMRVPEVPK